MALSEEGGNGMVMPVAPAYGGGNGFGNFGGDGWLIVLLLLFAAGGWGNGFGGNGGFVPYAMNTGNEVQRGFDQASVMAGLGDINAGIYGVQSAICNGFSTLEASNNARQIANMQNSFALQSQLASCCCENRLGTADLKYTVATENCADRTQAMQNTRDIIENSNRGIQMIMDKLCQQELENLRERNVSLQNQLNMATLRESQTAQTAQILSDNTKQTVALEQYLNPVPVPAYVVANPNCCQTTGCGCGM